MLTINRVLTLSIVLLAVASVRANEEAIEEYEERMGVPRQTLVACLEQAGLTVVQLQTLERSSEQDWDKPEIKELIPKAGCFLSCTFQKQGWMTGNKLEVEAMHKTVDERFKGDVNPEMHKYVDTCSVQAKDATEECEVALLFMVCIMKSLGML